MVPRSNVSRHLEETQREQRRLARAGECSRPRDTHEFPPFGKLYAFGIPVEPRRGMTRQDASGKPCTALPTPSLCRSRFYRLDQPRPVGLGVVHEKRHLPVRELLHRRKMPTLGRGR